MTVSLARSMVEEGNSVGILDADLNTPNVPLMMGYTPQERVPMEVQDYEIVPHQRDGVKVVSYWFDTADTPHLLSSQDRINNMLNAFCRDVNWGGTEILLVDAPPATADELVGVINMMGHINGGILVVEGSTVVSVEDALHARRTFEHYNVPIAGYVKNKVSQYYNDEEVDVDAQMDVPLLGEVKLKKRSKKGLDLTKEVKPVLQSLGIVEKQEKEKQEQEEKEKAKTKEQKQERKRKGSRSESERRGKEKEETYWEKRTREGNKAKKEKGKSKTKKARGG